MRKWNPYIVTPLTLLTVTFLSTKAFDLLSAKSDSSVFFGICLGLLTLVILYKFITYILNKPI